MKKDDYFHNQIFPKILLYASDGAFPEFQIHALSYIESLSQPGISKLILPTWAKDATPNLQFSTFGWEIRNDGWMFQSVRCKYAKSNSGVYIYEIVLKSDEIIQVGWASDFCVFDPESGNGVGDDIHSYSFDGDRLKKWHKGDLDVIQFKRLIDSRTIMVKRGIKEMLLDVYLILILELLVTD